jgi:RHS repeat-associated protein
MYAVQIDDDDAPGTWSAPTWSSTPHTLTAFDELGRPTSVTNPGSIVTTIQYDGRHTVVIDPNGHKKESITDNLGRLIEVKEFTGSSTYTEYANMLYDYDVRGLLVGVTDDASNATTIEYDALGRKVGMDDPDLGEWAYTYDLWSQMETQTDARGEQIQFEYDKLGRLIARSIWTGSAWQTVATFSYDSTASGNKGIGRQTGMVSYLNGQTLAADAIVYNQLGQAASASRQVDVDDDGTYDYTFSTSSTYDSIGRVLTQTLPDPDLSGSLSAETLTYNYNARGLFENISGLSSYQYVTETNYTPTGRVDIQKLGNAVDVDFAYDSTTDRMTDLRVVKPGTPPFSDVVFLDFDYTYDDAGNIETIVDDVRDERHEFVYDHLDRLTTADICTGTITNPCSAGGQTLTEQRDYTYNVLGNITSYTYNSGSAASYTYSGVTAGPHAATGYNGWTYTYDANGNMTSRDNGVLEWTHTYDEQNRLVTVSDGTTTTDYIYDGNGARLMRRVGNTTTLYVMGMELDLTVNVGTPSHSWNKTSLYYPVSGAFRVVESGDSTYNDTVLYYLHGDYLGSTSVISDSTGVKVSGSDATYAPFGEMRGGTSLPTLTDFGYTGQTLDRNSGGIMYYGARYYLPELRRFISADSLVPDGSSSQAYNRYSYVLNNPVNFVDPSGHTACGMLPTGDIRSFCEKLAKIASLTADIALYGVDVNIDWGIGLDDQIAALEILLNAVSALAELAYNTLVSEYPQELWDRFTAFAKIFGPTEITLKDGDKLKSNGLYGVNNGWNATKGKFEIEITANSLLRKWDDETFTDDDIYTGIGVAVHEIAHNIGYALYDMGENDHYYPGVPEFTAFGVRAGDYAYGTQEARDANGDWTAEATSDVIANLALDSFIGPNAEAARQSSMDYFKDEIGAILKIMNCRVNGC